MSGWLSVLAGLACGLLSGLGIGGGSLLMLWMTGVAGLSQKLAQGINLLYFLPTAGAGLPLHLRNGFVRRDIVLPAALCGCAVGALCAWLAAGLDSAFLRKLFGLFLLAVGFSELFAKNQDSG